MAVVINEFEAVAEPQQQTGSDSAAAAHAPATILPRDLRPALILLAARRARLRAH